MSPTLRLLWMLVRWPGLLLMVAFALQVNAASASQDRRQFLMKLIGMAGCAVWVGVRYRDFAASKVWRWLPDGERVLTRALAILVLFGMSVVAAVTCWAQARGVVQLPIRNVPLAFAALAGVAFLAFAHRLPKIQPRVAQAFIVTLTLLFVEAIFREPSMGLSWVTAVSVGVLWLYVVITAGVPPEGWVARARDFARTFELRMSTLGLARRAPARLLLQAGQPVKATLPIAFLGTLAVCLMLRDLLAIRAHDSLSALLGGASGFIAVAILFMAMSMAHRGRLLWLRFGDSRAQVLRECERALLVNLLAITLVVWLAVAAVAVGFASWRMWPRLLAGLPAVAVGSLPALYLGLAWPTFAGKWRDMPNGHIILAAIILLPVVWRAAYAVVQPLELKPDPLPIVFTLLAAMVLRAFAVWRWRKIDWSCLKIKTT
ncbi:MAG TPA: hypothetical protein VFU13_22690 [Steroidobacteraceae bacterium]|nr:hypothetical protein [Steroidobacteraceae bacterium]